MPDNLIVCQHCQGTGELRVSWWVEYRYQDCSEYAGPFGTQAEAESRLAQATPDPGCMMQVIEKIQTTESK